MGIRTVVREDKALVLETLVDVAIALEVGGRDTKLGCVGIFARKTMWETAATGKEPSLDGIAVPFHDIVSTLSSIEVRTKGVCADFVDIAARRTGSIVRAILTDGRVALAEAIDFALGIGMQDIFVHGVVVDTFNDVDLDFLLAYSVVVKLGTARTSPLTGHGSSPRDQKAGHMPQTPGIRLTSRMKRPLL
jgi:hypothetical protein